MVTFVKLNSKTDKISGGKGHIINISFQKRWVVLTTPGGSLGKLDLAGSCGLPENKVCLRLASRMRASLHLGCGVHWTMYPSLPPAPHVAKQPDDVLRGEV